jgi:hypothetical protein
VPRPVAIDAALLSLASLRMSIPELLREYPRPDPGLVGSRICLRDFGGALAAFARDLAVTTDFRALFSEIAGRHLGIAQPTALFPGWRDTGAPLGLL